MPRASPYTVCLVAALLCSCTTVNPPAAPDSGAGPSEDSSIEAFLNGYFRSWSDADMDAYRAHFAPDAVIRFSRGGKVIWTRSLDAFVAEQKALKSGPGASMVERMVSFETLRKGGRTIAIAGWELTKREGVKTGVDRFTLARDASGRWRIADMLFYFTSEKPR